MWKKIEGVVINIDLLVDFELYSYKKTLEEYRVRCTGNMDKIRVEFDDYKICFVYAGGHKETGDIEYNSSNKALNRIKEIKKELLTKTEEKNDI